jgi:hypothetical protein
MKHLFITSLLSIFAISGNAQFLNFKGLTVQATSNLYIERDEPKSETVDQLYIMSFSDKILTHIIFSEGSVSDSQIYQMEYDISFMDGENTIYKFDAVSGLSGNRFKYEIKIAKDGKLISLKLTQPSGSITIFKGGVSTLKTFKQ